MLIRLATSADISQIMQLIGRVVPLMQAAGNFQWDDTYPNPEVFENDINLKQLWVAMVDDVIGGVTAITTQQEPEYTQVGWDITETAVVTHRLAVDPACQGMGVAAALLKQAETVAGEKGIGILRIDTSTRNEATQRLFPKMGYQYAGEIGLAFRPGIRVYCYQKMLPAK